jgi:hypothetical protein
MATISKQILSGSTNGRLVRVTGQFAIGTKNLIHTAPVGTSSMDEVYLYAVNNYTSDLILVIEFGGTDLQDRIGFTIPSRVGMVAVVEKLLVQNGNLVQAYVDTTGTYDGSGGGGGGGGGGLPDWVMNIGGYVNRIVP